MIYLEFSLFHFFIEIKSYVVRSVFQVVKRRDFSTQLLVLSPNLFQSKEELKWGGGFELCAPLCCLFIIL